MERPDGSRWKRRRQEEMIVNDKIKGILSNILYIACVFLFSFLIVRYVGQRTEVIGSSMVPTLEAGDQLITDTIS